MFKLRIKTNDEKEKALCEDLEDYVFKERKKFNSFKEKLDYLINHKYIDESILIRHPEAEIEQLYFRAQEECYVFESFEEAAHFYDTDALRTRDTDEVLEDIEDRVVWVALSLANGDSIDALRYVRAILRKEFLVTPSTFNKAGKRTLNDSKEVVKAY